MKVTNYEGMRARNRYATTIQTGRRLREGDIYARSPEFLHFDPGYMLGTEVHHQTVGIVGLGGIGYQGRDSMDNNCFDFS